MDIEFITNPPPKPCTLTEVEEDADFEQLISSLPPSALAVIYFHAPWAVPCQRASLILQALASTFESTSPPQIVFLCLDGEKMEDTSEKYDVTQVPLIVLQKGGKILDSIPGTHAKKIRDAVELHGGRGALPPVQNVTRPAFLDRESPALPASGPVDLTKYAPDPKDPATAPEFSSSKIKEKEDGELSTELKERLASLIKCAPVMLFMKGTPSVPQCGFSRKTVALLREKNVRYGFFNILADDEVRQGLKIYSDWPTFPQLYVEGELIGGMEIIQDEVEAEPEFLKQYIIPTKKATV